MPWKTLLSTLWRTQRKLLQVLTQSQSPACLLGTLLDSLMGGFPVNIIANLSCHFKVTHSHTDSRLGSWAWTDGLKLSLCLPWLCYRMGSEDRGQAWKQKDPAQSLKLHVPLLGWSEDFITPESWFLYSYSGKTDRGRSQLWAIHWGNNNNAHAYAWLH